MKPFKRADDPLAVGRFRYGIGASNGLPTGWRLSTSYLEQGARYVGIAYDLRLVNFFRVEPRPLQPCKNKPTKAVELNRFAVDGFDRGTPVLRNTVDGP